MTGFGVAPRATNQSHELLAALALGVTSGALTTYLLTEKKRQRSLRLLLGMLVIDAILMNVFRKKYGGI